LIDAHGSSIVLGGGPADPNGDQLGGSLAVSGDLLGKAYAERIQALLEGFEVFSRQIDSTCCSVGQKQNGVVGAHVAVNGDAIERLLDGFLKAGRQVTGGNWRIGCKECQHGCHVRCNHAGAFGDAAKGDLAPGQLELDCGLLGDGIGRQDGFGCMVPCVPAQLGEDGWDAGFQFVHGQGNPNHACGIYQDFIRREAQTLCD